MMMTKSEHLRWLLDRFVPSGPEQTEFVRRMSDLNGRGTPAFERTTFDPGHFTASAFVLSPDAASVLLILHQKLDRWLQPGGHVDPEDVNILAAAQREVAEEAGLANLTLEAPGIFDVDIHAIPKLGSEPPHAHFDVRFLFRSENADVAAATDAVAARWVPLEQVASAQSDASVMRAIELIRRR